MKRKYKREFRTEIIPFIALAGFITLANYSMDHAIHKHEMGYTKADLAGMEKLIDDSTKPRWKTKQAAALADIYFLTEDDVVKPVRLWKR